MAGLSIVDFIAGLLLQILPSPIIWGVILLSLFAIYMFLKNMPNSAISHFSLLLIMGLASIIGGVFEVLKVALIALAGGAFFLGLWQFIGRR